MNDPICPNCRAPILPDAPGGLCPSCLLLAAALSTGGLPGGLANAPSVESVRAAFPELEILELFGHGGMGVVFKARQPRLERLVALKILPPALAVQPGFSERFIREARTLGRLSHPNIVGVYDFGERAGFYYLIMEFVNGVNLRQAMRAGVTPEQALALVPRICEALQFAHDHGVLHRDIKPENILLDTEGTPKLADFGIAKIAGATGQQSGLTQTGASLGTAVYMAPEQIERPATVDHRADIYSLGVVLYEMLTGELPLGRFAAPSEKSSVARGVDELVLRALEKERERRQQSATQMKTDVENVTHPGTPATGTVPVPATAPGDLGWYLGRFFIAMAILCAAMIPLAGASPRLQAIVTPATLALLCPVFGGLVAASHLLFGNRRPGPGATLLGARFWKRFAVGMSVLVIAGSISIPVIRTIRGRDSLPGQAQLPRPASAVVTPDHAPFSAKIGDGSLELMGIANSPSAGQTWWTMDGYRSPSGYAIEKRDLPMKAGERAYDVVFRRKGFPEGTTFGGYQISGGSVSSSGSLVEATAKPGEKLAGYEGLTLVLPGDARTVTIRAAVASESWHTLSDTAANNSLQGSVNYAGHEWRYQHGAASETKGGETVVTFHGAPPPDWEMGVRAVTKSGREIAPAHHSQLEDQWEWSFPTQSADAIAEFRLQVRPIDWVEFHDIALPPVAAPTTEAKAVTASAAPVDSKAPVEKPPVAVVTPKMVPPSAKIGAGSIEFVGVSKHGSNGPWWGMDGSPAKGPGFPITRFLGLAEGYDLVFHRQGFLPGSSTTTFETKDSKESFGSETLDNPSFLPGSEWPDYELVHVNPADGKRVISIWVGVNSEPWHTLIADHTEVNAIARKDTPSYENQPWDVYRSVPMVSKDGDTVISMVYDVPANWEARVTVVVDGKELNATGSDGSARESQYGAMTGWTWSFHTKGKLADEVRFQVRPIDWVEFRDIPLAPPGANPIAPRSPGSSPPTNPTTQLKDGGAPSPSAVDALYEKSIELARKNLERLQARSDAKLVSQEELDEAGQNLAIAEARGNALLENQARLTFLDKQLLRVQEQFKKGVASAEEVDALELKKNQVQLEMAKAQPRAVSAEPVALKAIYDEGLRLAKENLESTQKMEKVGVVVHADVRAAERDVAIAEARGDAVLVAQARLAYAGEYLVMLQEHQKTGTVSADDVHQAEVAKNQASAELAKAQAAGGQPSAKAETPEAKANEDEAIRLAREYVEKTRQQYHAGILSQIEVRAAECELEVAEARGDALRIAKARVAYTTDLVEVDQKRFQTGTVTSAELYQAQLAHNQAKADLLKAQIAAGETPGKDR